MSLSEGVSPPRCRAREVLLVALFYLLSLLSFCFVFLLSKWGELELWLGLIIFYYMYLFLLLLFIFTLKIRGILSLHFVPFVREFLFYFLFF